MSADEFMPAPARSGTISSRAGTAGIAIDDAWNNRSVQNAIQILDQLSDLGRTLPFVAPAFVLLSLIIQVEKRARDADAKCTDLLERITFMMGHLSVLRRVKVMEETRRVIDRMNEVLRDSASLIQAYRKQNVIVRRLHIGNVDKFSSCVQAVNSCSSDLMMSLQIHQTGQLDILTRNVPVDIQDEAARTFVTSHGGVETVKDDVDLVSEFAKETLHMKVGEEVMAQINTNLSDLMAENRLSLEHMLSGTVSTAIVDGIKELANQVTAAEMEQRFTCVQCESLFRVSTNGPASCNYHRTDYSSWNKRYPCCNSNNAGCQFNYHRVNHHCEYPYGSFFTRAYKISNYIDTVDKWTSVEDNNLISGNQQKAYIGQLLRWVSRGDSIEEPTIIISVGTIWYTEKYFFDTFTSKDLEDASQVLGMTGNRLIFRNSPKDEEYAMAEWEVSETGTIAGVRITVKAATSETPFIRVCLLDIPSCTKSGEVQALSDGGLRSYKPETAYILPDTIRITHELGSGLVRPTRTDFKTQTSPALPIILRPTSQPPLTPNENFARLDADNFEGTISVFNKSPAASVNPITIASVSATFRLVGDEHYSPALIFELLDDIKLPVTIEPRQSWPMRFKVTLPRLEKDTKLEARWFYRAFIARKRPVRVKLLLEDIEGEKASVVVEHVFDPRFPLDQQKEKDIDFFYFDDSELWSRNGVHVERTDYGDNLLTFSGSTGDSNINTVRLQKIVYEALKTGETEVDLQIGGEKDDGAWEWGAWALVDLSCRRVYAFKVLIQQGKKFAKKTLGCLGYVLCPDYGDVIDQTKPIQYANEKVKLPPLEPLVAEDAIIDDVLDDILPDPPKVIPNDNTHDPSNPSLPGQAMLPDDLTNRLTSIDTNLSRIADALELLMTHLTARST